MTRWIQTCVERPDVSPIVTSWTLAVVALMWPGALLAQQSEAETIRRANALAAAGNHVAAVRALRRAQIDTPSPQVDLNLALSFAELGRLRQARALLHRVITSDANPLLVDTAREQLRAVEAQLPRLTVRVDESASELQVDSRTFRVDGRVLNVSVDPGAHHLELRAPDGSIIARRHVDLAVGERETVSMRPRPARARVTRRAPAEPSLAAVTVSRSEEAAPLEETDPNEAGAAEELEPSEDPSPPTEIPRATETNAEPASRVLDAPSPERRSRAAARDDALVWIIAAAGGATAVLVVVVTAALLAAQPQPTMGDVPPVWVGG